MAPISHSFPTAGRLVEDAKRLRDVISRDLGSSHLARRTEMISIPSTYSDITDSPPIVVAIVLGTVCGFVLLMWVLALIFSPRGPFPLGDRGTVTSASETSRTHSSYGRTRSRRRRPEVVEVHESPSVSAASREREDDMYDDDDYDSADQAPSHRRSGGYRTVDPRKYAGGGRSGRR